MKKTWIIAFVTLLSVSFGIPGIVLGGRNTGIFSIPLTANVSLTSNISLTANVALTSNYVDFNNVGNKANVITNNYTGDIVVVGNMSVNGTVSANSVLVNGDVQTTATNALYLGDAGVDGSWRIIRSGNNLAFQRRESGVWNNKSMLTP